MASRRFAVALSFPGEKRDFVRRVAKELSGRLGQQRVLYDDYLTAELARGELDLYLPDLYRNDSELLVPFFCEEYDKKKWCNVEWKYMRSVVFEAEGHRVMPFRFDDAPVPGQLPTDGYVKIGNRTPKEVAELILQRVGPDGRALERGQRPLPVFPAANVGRLEDVGASLDPEVSIPATSPVLPKVLPPARFRMLWLGTAILVVLLAAGAWWQLSHPGGNSWLPTQPQSPTPVATLCTKDTIRGHPASVIHRRQDLRLKVDDVRLEVATDCRTTLLIRSQALENFRLPPGGEIPYGGAGPWIRLVFKDRLGAEVKRWKDADQVLSAGVEDCKGTSINSREIGLGDDHISFSIDQVKRIASFEWEFASEWTPEKCGN